MLVGDDAVGKFLQKSRQRNHRRNSALLTPPSALLPSLHRVLGDADGVDEEELLLAVGVGRDGAELVGVDRAAAASAHLHVERVGVHVAHEEEDLERTDVGAGGDERDGDGDAEGLRVAELADQLLRVAGGVGDRLNEVGGLSVEDLAGDLDDAAGVVFGLREDERLREGGEVGRPGEVVHEHLGVDGLLVGFEDLANLVGLNDCAVEGGRVVVDVLLGGGRLALARPPRDHVDGLALGDVHALGGGARLDAVDLVVDVDAVRDGLLVGVVDGEVLVEELQRLGGGRGGEADEASRVEVVEHRAPASVDRAVAFVDDNCVEVVAGEFECGGRSAEGGVDFRLAHTALNSALRTHHSALNSALRTHHSALLILLRVGLRGRAGQRRVKPLDGRDGEARLRVRLVALDALRDEDVGERRSVLRQAEGRELVDRLFAEVVAVDEEEDALRGRVGEEAIGRHAGGVGLARAGREHEECLVGAATETRFKMRDGLDLAFAQFADLVGRQFGETRPIGVDAQGVGAFLRGEHLREGEEPVAGRAVILEEAFAQERPLAVGEEDEEAVGVPDGVFRGDFVGVVDGLFASGLFEVDVGTLGFENADDLAVEEEEVVGFEVAVQETFGECHRVAGGGEVVAVADVPAGVGELRVDPNAGALLRP